MQSGVVPCKTSAKDTTLEVSRKKIQPPPPPTSFIFLLIMGKLGGGRVSSLSLTSCSKSSQPHLYPLPNLQHGCIIDGARISWKESPHSNENLHYYTTQESHLPFLFVVKYLESVITATLYHTCKQKQICISSKRPLFLQQPTSARGQKHSGVCLEGTGWPLVVHTESTGRHRIVGKALLENAKGPDSPASRFPSQYAGGPDASGKPTSRR